MRGAEGGAKIVGVFRVKESRFYAPPPPLDPPLLITDPSPKKNPKQNKKQHTDKQTNKQTNKNKQQKYKQTKQIQKHIQINAYMNIPGTL